MIIINKKLSWIKNIQRNNIFYIFLVVQLVCIILYYFMSMGLEKPAGLIEAIKFYFNSPAEYILSMFIGILAWIFSFINLLSLLFEVPIIKDLFDYDYYNNSYEFEDLKKEKIIINCIGAILLFVASLFLLRFLLLLTLTFFGIGFGAMFLISSSNN